MPPSCALQLAGTPRRQAGPGIALAGSPPSRSSWCSAISYRWPLCPLRRRIVRRAGAGDAAPVLLPPRPRSWHRPRATLAAGWRRQRASIDNLAASAQAIVDGLPDPLIAVDRQRRIVRTNRAAVALLGTMGADRDLSTALRHPQLLAAIDLATGKPARRQFFDDRPDGGRDRAVGMRRSRTSSPTQRACRGRPPTARWR